MEFPSSGSLKPLTIEEFDTTRHLAHAARQASERGFDKITIVDADTHHDETGSFRNMVDYIDSTVERQKARANTNEGRRPMIPHNISYADIGGRMQRFAARKLEKTPANVHRDITLTRRSMTAMGATFGVLYPTASMRLAIQPKKDWEYQLTLAYNRWVANDLLAQEPQIKGMLYLPLHHTSECLKMIEELGGKPGVAGCVVAFRALREDPAEGHDEGPGSHAGARHGARLPRHGQLGGAQSRRHSQMGRGAGDRRAAVQHGPHDQLADERDARAVPQAQGAVVRIRRRLGALPDAAARYDVHGARLGSAAAEGEAEPLHGADVSTARSRSSVRTTRPRSKSRSAPSMPRRSWCGAPISRRTISTCRRRSGTCHSSPSKRRRRSSAETPCGCSDSSQESA